MYQLRLIKLEDTDPILADNLKHFDGRRTIIEEEDFCKYVLHSAKSRTKLSKDHNTIYHHFNTSMKYYQLKYPEWDWNKRKKLVYAASKYGNKHGAKAPSILVPKETLEKYTGKSVEYIARQINVSPFLIRRAIHTHKMSTGQFPARVVDADFEILSKLETLSPGIRDAVDSYYTDPTTFFKYTQIALDELYELLWFLQDFKPSYRYLLESGKIARPDGIVLWSTNRQERQVGISLRKMGVKYQPQFVLGKYFWDFLVGDNLLVEIDGEYHEVDDATKQRDALKYNLATGKGFKVVRFTTKQVDKNIEEVLLSIKESLNEDS